MDNRYYFDDIENNRVVIKGNQAQHLLRVRRAKLGDEIMAFNGNGYDYKLKISEIAKDKAYQRTGMNPEFRIQNGKLFPWMKVERYYIRTLDRLIESEGFIDHTTNIAYEEDETLIMSEDKWKATDIETGLLIEKDRGFAELYDKVFKMKDIINERRLTRDYMTFKQQFEMIKNGDLGRIVKIES